MKTICWRGANAALDDKLAAILEQEGTGIGAGKHQVGGNFDSSLDLDQAFVEDGLSLEIQEALLAHDNGRLVIRVQQLEDAGMAIAVVLNEDRQAAGNRLDEYLPVERCLSFDDKDGVRGICERT